MCGLDLTNRRGFGLLSAQRLIIRSVSYRLHLYKHQQLFDCYIKLTHTESKAIAGSFEQCGQPGDLATDYSSSIVVNRGPLNPPDAL